MRAVAEAVDPNLVRLSVEVEEAEINEALDATVRRLSREVRIPGFRRGKVPRKVLEARVGGASALRQQAISDALPDFYALAIRDVELDPIAPPEIDITSGSEEGPMTFDAVVQIRPKVAIPGYGGLVVTGLKPDVSEEDVDAQVDRLREQGGELQSVDRPAREKDYVTIDLHGSPSKGEEIDLQDYLYEIGGGVGPPGLDDQLVGAKPGDVLEFDNPGDAQGGISTSFRVLVKEIKQKELPVASDEWASEVSEFATIAELRGDLQKRLKRVKVLQARLLLREQALEGLVGLVEEEPPQPLVDREIRERLHDLQHRLEARRISLDEFMAASGRDEETLLTEIRAEAARAVRVDLALRSLADAESIELSDEELDGGLREMAEQAGSSLEEVRRRLDHSGRLPAVRSEQRKAKALAWLLDNVQIVDGEGNAIKPEELRVEVNETSAVGESAAGESMLEAAE